MGKLSASLIILLFVAAIHNPATAAPQIAIPFAPSPTPRPVIPPNIIDDRPQGWKTAERFEISNIDGYREDYLPEEPIVLYVEGKSEKLSVERENGFYVTAALHNVSDAVAQIATIEYDAGRHAWQVKLTAPNDISKLYKISVHLLCARNESSPCAVAYGEASSVDKDLPIQLR